ncbi:MAG TPA: carbohydrate ABC transporter permease [Chthoniobacterales bacterium]|jgi:ABC-type glycerol-3-phosphate transport system permease component
MKTAITPPAPAPTKKRSDWGKHLFIWIVLLIEFLPFYMMMQISVKNNSEFLQNPWLPLSPAQWHWENWVFGIKLVGPYVINTIFVAVLGTLFSVFFAVLGAYFFARVRMPGSDFFWAAFLVLMLLPGVANIVPLFQLLKSLNLLNSLWALIILGTAGGQVFAIFVLRNFIEDLPRDLFEAAEMDGASHFRQVCHIVFPMSAPIIGTLSILAFLGQWNDFLMPLIVLRDHKLFTLGVGLIYLDGEYVKQWGQIMAAFFISSIPLIIIFMFCMKLFVRGLSAGGVKG